MNRRRTALPVAEVPSDEPQTADGRRHPDMADTIFSSPLLAHASLEEIGDELARRNLDFFVGRWKDKSEVLCWKEKGEC
jgi:hypothetical protein